jgi:hypothetical protein
VRKFLVTLRRGPMEGREIERGTGKGEDRRERPLLRAA